jgi:glycosyltransferase involved in cell wall biosynthesis
MTSGVTLITPTGNRPESLKRCAGFVSRFKYPNYIKDVQWIVVDDGYEASCFSALVSEVTLIRPNHRWQPGQNTLGLNLLAAIPEVKHDVILFIEDDDYYHEEYAYHQIERLQEKCIAGETRAHYYHVPSLRYQVLDNKYHASLCQTGIQSSELGTLEKICKLSSSVFIDVQLWNSLLPRSHALADNSAYCIGMKGLPGRSGIGIGHRPTNFGWKSDHDLKILKSWIGSDIELYGLKFPEFLASSV